VVTADQTVERLLWRDVVGQREQLAGHDAGQLGEPVDVGTVTLRHHADRAALGDHHDGTVRALGQQVERERHGVGRGQLDRGVVDQMAALDPGHRLGDHVDRDVLRDDRQPAPAGHGLGHPPTGDRGHVGHHDRNRRAAPVVAGQVHVEPGLDGRPAGDHEDVVVGQLVLGHKIIEKAHGTHKVTALALVTFRPFREDVSTVRCEE
jgi:hypothetical protein